MGNIYIYIYIYIYVYRGLPYFHEIENVVKDTFVHPDLKRRAFFICALLENEFYEHS